MGADVAEIGAKAHASRLTRQASAAQTSVARCSKMLVARCAAVGWFSRVALIGVRVLLDGPSDLGLRRELSDRRRHIGFLSL